MAGEGISSGLSRSASGLPRREARALRRATRLLLDDVGCKRVEAIVGRGHAQVGRWHNRDDVESWPNVANLRVIEDHAEFPHVTAELARLAGGRFVPLPDASGDTTRLAARLIEIMERVGRVAGETQRAIADGVCSASEAGGVRPIVAEAIAALVGFDSQLCQIERGELVGRQDEGGG